MPKIVDHDQRRAEMLNGCIQLWAERGYSAVSMREVAKTLKVSTGMLYHYFENKEDLFFQMVQWMMDRDLERATKFVKRGQTMQEKLELLFEYIESEREYFQQFLLIAVDYYRHHQTANLAPIGTVLEAFRSRIQEELGLPSPIASIILSTILGALIQSMLDTHNNPLPQHAALLQQVSSILL